MAEDEITTIKTDPLPVEYIKVAQRRTRISQWERTKIQADYMKGMSHIEISRKYNISDGRVSAMIRNYGWRKQKDEMRNVINEQLRNEVINRTRKSQQHASKLFERTLKEGDEWLDEIQKQKETLMPGQIRQLKELIESWKMPIEVTRKALGMDERQQSQSVVNIAVLHDADSHVKVELEKAREIEEGTIDIPNS